MFSNSLTMPGCLSRCKCLSGPLLPPPRYFVDRTWRHLEIDPQFSTRIENLSTAPLKTDTGPPPIHMVSEPPKFLVTRVQHSCIYTVKRGAVQKRSSTRAKFYGCRARNACRVTEAFGTRLG